MVAHERLCCLRTWGWLAALGRLCGRQGVPNKEAAGVVAGDEDASVGGCSLVSIAIQTGSTAKQGLGRRLWGRLG